VSGLPLGFVVAKYDPASGQASLASTEIHRTQAEAQRELERLTEDAKASGRRDMYSIGQVSLVVGRA
jgi:hypothetical protein